MDLAYIDREVTEGLDRRFEGIVATEADKESARKAGARVIAGFDVFDEAAERKALDGMIASRRAKIEVFQKDRAAVREALDKRGIAPLAVVPVKAWKALCGRAGLFRLHPDAQSRVGYSERAWDGLPAEATTPSKKWPRGTGDETLDNWARSNWDRLLRLLFPGGESTAGWSKATLVLPLPPDDVAAVLMKADGLTMHVAAEAAAIDFKERPSQLRKAQAVEAERRAQALRADPIVYVEQGTATAIIAQFGDFPIEKAVVDAVVSSDDLIPDGPLSPAHPAQYGGGLDEYLGLRWSTEPASKMWRQRVLASQIAQRNMLRPIIGLDFGP